MQLHVKDTLPVYIVSVIDNQGPRAWLPGFATLEQCSEKISLKEFTVAPYVNPKKGLPFHQWWIEFDQQVSQEKIKKTEKELDFNLQSLNSYYKDLVQGKVLKPLEIVVVKKEGFKSYMESIGKLGGQNKLPRLSNDRKIVDQLINYVA